ncbi:MAG: hypothetical protein ACC628_19795 [Pirellulaceae bacterium]
MSMAKAFAVIRSLPKKRCVHGDRIVAFTVAACVLWSCTTPAYAIPVFARKYRTSCITCHAGYPKLNSLGEAFRRNGYQYPRGDLDMVKDEPLPLGTDTWKEMWPDSIWPNDIPGLPPVSFLARLGYNVFLDTPDGEPATDFQFPLDFNLLSGGTLGEDISWYAAYVLAGRGAHGASGVGGTNGHALESELERFFVQFDNLFAWSEEDDEDGMRAANRGLALPRHALNLRVGQFEPGVIAPWASIHRQLGIQGRLPNLAGTSNNGFLLEPSQRGIEFNGVLRNYLSYAAGMVNGNGVVQAYDNNSDKDFYFRVARKWWGYPLDGQVVPIGQDASESDGEPEVEVSGDFGPRSTPSGSTVSVRAQSPDESLDFTAPGLDFWRETSFETGFFGYFGRNATTVTVQQPMFVGSVAAADLGSALDVAHLPVDVPAIHRFERFGFDARWTRGDWDIYGAWVWARDREPLGGFIDAVEKDNFFTWFVEANYYYKPWLIAYGRYEQSDFQGESALRNNEIARGVVGAAGYLRSNVRLVGEIVLDAGGNDTTDDSAQLVLDLAY